MMKSRDLLAPSARHASLAIGVALLSLLAHPAAGQEDPWAPEIPLVRETGVSARSLGMGGAYLAVSDDAAALHYNIAGLARVQRVEFAASLMDLQREMRTVMEGDQAKGTMPRTRLTALGFAYPFPVYRGSLVFGAGYAAPWLLDREYVRSAVWDDSDQSLNETVHEEGSAGEWTVGLALDATPEVSFGARASWIRGTHFQDWVFERAMGPQSYSAHRVTDIDLSGFTASLGAIARVFGWGRFGLVIDLPRWVNLQGTVTKLDDPDAPRDFAIDQDMTLPMSVGTGLTTLFAGLLCTADARFTDWTQIDYLGPLRADTGKFREFAYRRTADLHFGLEYLLDIWPRAGMRLRAGYAREPVPYRVVLQDIDVNGDPVYRTADFDPDRSTFTIGGGVLLQESLTIDAAYAYSHFERRGGTLVEKESENQVLVSAAFRLK